MAKIRYVKFNPDEWLVGTFGLSCGECGTYVQTISLLYSSGGKILPTDERLMRSLNTKPNIIKKHLLSLVSKNKLEFDGKYLVNKRVLNELQRVSKRLANGTQTDSKRTVKDSENELNQSLTKTHTIDNNTNHNSINNKTKLKSKKALKTDQTALKDFENLWKSWRKKSGRKLALESYFRSILTHSSQAIKNGAKQYNIENAETEKKFILMLSTFLNQERFLDYNFDEKQTDKTQKNESSIWEERCRWNKRSGYWSHDWGNPPDSPRNDVPEKYLIKYGFINGQQSSKPPKEKT